MLQIHTISIDQLKEAVLIKEQIANLEIRMAALIGEHSSGQTVPDLTPKARGSFKRSPETLARMKAAQQARWAKIKGTVAPVLTAPVTSPVSSDKAPKQKAGISPEGRAKLAAAMKARWAAKKQTASAAPAAKAVSAVRKFVKKY